MLPLCSQAAAAAFASLDTDGSGYLEPSELCHAFRALEQGLSDEEMRVLLAYLHLGVDKVSRQYNNCKSGQYKYQKLSGVVTATPAVGQTRGQQCSTRNMSGTATTV
jgi:hypothetical protein